MINSMNIISQSVTKLLRQVHLKIFTRFGLIMRKYEKERNRHWKSYGKNGSEIQCLFVQDFYEISKVIFLI